MGAVTGEVIKPPLEEETKPTPEGNNPPTGGNNSSQGGGITPPAGGNNTSQGGESTPPTGGSNTGQRGSNRSSATEAYSPSAVGKATSSIERQNTDSGSNTKGVLGDKNRTKTIEQEKKDTENKIPKIAWEEKSNEHEVYDKLGQKYWMYYEIVPEENHKKIWELLEENKDYRKTVEGLLVTTDSFSQFIVGWRDVYLEDSLGGVIEEDSEKSEPIVSEKKAETKEKYLPHHCYYLLQQYYLL